MKILPRATRGAMVIEYDTESAGTAMTDQSSFPVAASSAWSRPSITGTITLPSYNATPRLLTPQQSRLVPNPAIERSTFGS